MKKLFLLLFLLSFSFAVQFLSGGATPGAVSPVVSPYDIGTAYFSVNPISDGFDYQEEPQNVDNPYHTDNSSFAIRLSSGESVSIKIKINNSFADDFPNDGTDYLIGYNMVWPTATSNVVINEARGFLQKGVTKTIGSISNSTAGDEDHYITIQWFFDLYKYKTIDAKVYDFTNAIEVIVE